MHDPLLLILSGLSAAVSALASLAVVLIGIIYRRDQANAAREMGKLEEAKNALEKRVQSLEVSDAKASERETALTRRFDELHSDLRDADAKLGEIRRMLERVMVQTGTPREMPAVRPRMPSRPDRG